MQMFNCAKEHENPGILTPTPLYPWPQNHIALTLILLQNHQTDSTPSHSGTLYLLTSLLVAVTCSIQEASFCFNSLQFFVVHVFS